MRGDYAVYAGCTMSEDLCAGCEDPACKRREAWDNYAAKMSQYIRSSSVETIAAAVDMQKALHAFGTEYKACYARINQRLENLKRFASELENQQ